MAFFAFAVIPVGIRQPNVEIVYVLMVLSIIGYGFCHQGANLRLRVAEVGGKGIDMVAANAIHQSQVLTLFFRRNCFLIPTVGNRNTKGFQSPAVTHIVEHEASLGDFHFALPLPLKNFSLCLCL